MQVNIFSLLSARAQKSVTKKIAGSQWLISFFIISLSILFFTSAQGQQQQNISATTIVQQPVNTNFRQHIASNRVTVNIITSPGTPFMLVYGKIKIERISPSPFTIEPNDSYLPSMYLQLNTPVFPLNSMQILDAIGGMSPGNLKSTGINLASITSNGNIVLPEGTYRLCYTVLNSDYTPISQAGTGCATFVIPPSQPQNAVTINTMLIPPAKPDILQMISSGGVKPTLLFNNPRAQNIQVKVFGKIESLSPKPFTISISPDYNQQLPVNLTNGLPVQLNSFQVMDAFANFNENFLILDGISLSELKDANNNLKLPEGNYRICFNTRYFTTDSLGSNASNPNLGCGSFSICYKAGAPQFTQPISNFNIQGTVPSIRLASPLIFTWTPPNATCGLNLSTINYDLEIREMMESQTITDAINNPPVFIKNSLPSSTFLLDTLLFKQVLQLGKRYVIRVKANSPMNSPIEIDNNGYSRVQAFMYGDGLPSLVPEEKTIVTTPEIPKLSTITTSSIKGKAVWSFKKAEEEFISGAPATSVLNNAINLPTHKVAGGMKIEQMKLAVDPNYRLVAINNQLSIAAISNPANTALAKAGIQSAAGNFVLVNNVSAPLNSAVTGDGELISKKDLNIQPEKGKILHPLAGAKVFLKGIKDKSTAPSNTIRLSGNITPIANAASLSTQLGVVNPNIVLAAGQVNANKVVATINPTYLLVEKKDQQDNLIGSGTTDAAGNFNINFIDPKFKNIINYSRIQIIIEHEDFERIEKVMNVTAPDENGNIDLGELQLVAKTYRFTPVVENLNVTVENLKIELFAPAGTYDQNPHYSFIANKEVASDKQTIAGKEYIRIASVQNGQTINKLFYQKGNYENYIVKITAKDKADYVTYMGVIPAKYGAVEAGAGNSKAQDESSKVISIEKKYRIKNHFPFVVGNVQALGENISPVSEAVVTVTYAQSDVEEEHINPKLKEDAKPASNSATVNKVSVIGQTTPKSPVLVASANLPIDLGSKLAAPGFRGLLNGKLTTTTDQDGNFRIENLPVLKSGAKFTIAVSASDPQMEEEKIVNGRKRGDSLVAIFDIKPEKYTITGIVVDADGSILENAQLRWKRGGGNPIDATSSGLFTTTSIYASDSLTITRRGYVSKTIFVDIREAATQKVPEVKDTRSKREKKAAAKVPVTVKPVKTDISSQVNAWATSLSALPSVKLATSQSPVITASNFGYMTASTANLSTQTNQNNVVGYMMPVYVDLFTGNEKNAGFKDLGKVGYLEKGSSKIKFVVTDLKTNTPLSGAIISIEETFDTTTNNTGEVIYTGGGESFTYTAKGPEGSKYIMQVGEVDLPPVDGSELTVHIGLEMGIMISGKVTSGGQSIEDAEIFLDGKSFITTKSKDDGSYVLYIPEGESVVKATKTNFYGKEVSRKFSEDEVVNFDLQDGGGKNISSLLGFDIELEKHSPDGAGETWTGSFVKLKSNSSFTISERTKLKFTDVKVTFDAEGNAVVAGNEVKTDLTELSMKLFGYIPIKIVGDPQIIVRKRVDGKGVIGGKIQLDIDQISSLGGILFDNTLKTLLVPLDGKIEEDIPIFTSDGSFPVSLEFGIAYAKDEANKAKEKLQADLQKKLDKAKGEAREALQTKIDEVKNAVYASIKVYDFDALLDLAKSKISKVGLELKGAIITPDLPIISSLPFEIETLKIGSDFSIQKLSVKADVNLKFSIASWSAEINSVGFDMNGFKVGGKVNVQIPKSPVTSMDFTNLGMGLKNIYGGSFTLPTEGLDLYEIIKLKAGSTPINFGEIGNSGIYKIGGAAKFAFDKLFSDTFEVPQFQIQTDGKFAITVPVDKSLDAGFAKFELHSIGVDASRSTPQIDVNGKFEVGTDLINFSAGGVHFKKSGYTVDKIGIGLNIPAVDVEGFVDLQENGFAGAASLSITGTPVTADVDFHYFKKAGGGIDLGATFAAGIYIPIGVVSISKVGGGFSYQTDSKKFSVNITGVASITGFDAAVSMDPIDVSIRNGPVIEGSVNLKVASLDVAKAGIIIDLDKSYFSVNVDATIVPLPDVATAKVNGLFILSAKKGDSYFFFGADIRVHLLGLLDGQGKFAIGAGVKNVKTRPGVSAYTQEIPDTYLKNGSFSGIYINANAEMGKKKSEALGFDVLVMSAKFWLATQSRFSLISNFNNGDFRISAGMNLEGGVEMEFLKFARVSATANACAIIAGGYDNARGWNFTASANGYGEIGIGKSCDCNVVCTTFLIPSGGKICVGAGADIEYSSKQGGLKKFALRRGNTKKCF